MTEGEQVKQLTTKILELWWPGEDPTTFDAPEDAELSEVTLVDLKAYATITAGYILQREAALRDKLEIAENGIVSLRDALAENEKLRKVAELADETWVAYMAGLITTNPDGVFDRLRLALHECEKGRTP